MTKTSIRFFLLFCMSVLACSGNHSGSDPATSDSTTVRRATGIPDSLATLRDSLLADTSDLQVERLEGADGRRGTVWHADGLLRVVRLPYPPNDEGVEIESDLVCIFASSGILFMAWDTYVDQQLFYDPERAIELKGQGNFREANLFRGTE